MDQSGHKGDSGDTRARYHKQCEAERDSQRLQHVDSQHKRREERGQGTIHVPSKHRSDENAGINEMSYSNVLII